MPMHLSGNRWYILLGMALTLFAGSVQAETKDLFNGRDLTGWVAMYGGEWTVEDGVLVGRNGTNWTTNPELSGSWLRTEKPYGDFTLELEYAINAKGNSGVHFRSALEKNPSFTGYEMQIVDDSGSAPRKSGTGSIYDVVAPTRNPCKPAGEWNRARITCQGKRIQIEMNGEKIVDHESDRSLRGYIGLQNHDSRAVVKFRNVRITEPDTKSAK
jgi:hypothetical protein